jgi:hypothetical protein
MRKNIRRLGNASSRLLRESHIIQENSMERIPNPLLFSTGPGP